MIESFVLAVVAFCAFLVAHAAYFWFFRPEHRWKSVQRMAIIFLVLYGGAFYWFVDSNWLNILSQTTGLPKFVAFANGALLYVFMFLTYGQVYFLIDRGVSARILIEILESDAASLSASEIMQRYNPETLERRRLDDMLYGGYLRKENDNFVFSKKGRWMARAFLVLKRLLRLYPGG